VCKTAPPVPFIQRFSPKGHAAALHDVLHDRRARWRSGALSSFAVAPLTELKYQPLIAALLPLLVLLLIVALLLLVRGRVGVRVRVGIRVGIRVQRWARLLIVVLRPRLLQRSIHLVAIASGRLATAGGVGRAAALLLASTAVAARDRGGRPEAVAWMGLGGGVSVSAEVRVRGGAGFRVGGGAGFRARG